MSKPTDRRGLRNAFAIDRCGCLEHPILGPPALGGCAVIEKSRNAADGRLRQRTRIEPKTCHLRSKIETIVKIFRAKKDLPARLCGV
jgi:hypothetical protein